MSSTSMKLALLNGNPEIFHSIQGEGVSQGVPSIFIRSSLCNLHCIWCDTDYTWNWKNTPWKHENDQNSNYQKFDKKDYIVEVFVDQIAEKIRQFPCHNVVLTGGEPLLQEKAWVELMQILKASDDRYQFEVETNGSKLPSEAFDSLVHQYNVSPKLSNSGNDSNLRINEAALTFFKKSPKSWFKFVIAEESDLDEAEKLIQKFSLSKNRVLLMPEGRDNETLQRRRLWLVDVCRDLGYRFSDRLHIQLWGSKRGV